MNVYVKVSVEIGANPNILVSNVSEMSDSTYRNTWCQKTENPRRVLLSQEWCTLLLYCNKKLIVRIKLI
jgi:hypothetical protein